MSVTSERLALRTDQIVKAHLQNGEVPDEAIIVRQLRDEFGRYYDRASDTYTINEPTWQLTNLSYREIADVAKWNLTQQSAATEMYVLYSDFINDAKLLTDRLYNYASTANLLRVKLSKLVDRIDNLLLLANDSSGFLYSFFDTFIDMSKVSLDEPYKTDAVVDTDKGLVELSRWDLDYSISGKGWVDTIINLQFLQNSPSDVSFSVLNPVVSSVPLSNALLPDIFNNKATAWQREITISGSGPLSSQLTVRVAPLDPVWVNKIDLNTKMPNYDNQLMIQTFYSQDGVSYQEVQTPANPLFVGKAVTINFTPVFATHFRFLITKQAADNGKIYNIGIQSINFIRTQYDISSEGNVLYSIPITFPDPNRPIGKVACEICENIPTGTSIDHYIVVGSSGNDETIPISPLTETTPKYSKIIDLGATGLAAAGISTASESGYLQWAETSGRLYINVNDISANANTLYGDTIAQTLEVFRGIGPVDISGATNNNGFRVPPSGLGSDFFASYILVNNQAGSTIDFGSEPAILDGKEVEGTISMGYGLHQVATRRLDQHQGSVSENSDKYFAWNAMYVSPFEFYNNYATSDPSVFTYDSNGNIIVNKIQDIDQTLNVDYDKTFEPGNHGDGTFLSISQEIVSATAALSGVAPSSGFIYANAGASVVMTVGPEANWVNELQFNFTPNTTVVTFRVESSLDLNTWLPVGTDQDEPNVGGEVFGSIIFDNPIYAKYVRLYIVNGSRVDLTNSKFSLYSPVFKSGGPPYSLYTKPIYLPASNTWYSVQNTGDNPGQVYKFWDAFTDTLVDNSVYAADITNVKCPKVYMQVNSSSIPAYTSNVLITSKAVQNEKSYIKFAFHGLENNENTYKELRFKAILKSTIAGITPELLNYRVRLS